MFETGGMRGEVHYTLAGSFCSVHPHPSAAGLLHPWLSSSEVFFTHCLCEPPACFLSQTKDDPEIVISLQMDCQHFRRGISTVQLLHACRAALGCHSAVKAALLPADLLLRLHPGRSPRSWQRSAIVIQRPRDRYFSFRGSPVTPAPSRRRPIQRRRSGVRRRCSGVCLILLDGGAKAHATTAHSSASSFILRFAGSFSPLLTEIIA